MKIGKFPGAGNRNPVDEYKCSDCGAVIVTADRIRSGKLPYITRSIRHLNKQGQFCEGRCTSSLYHCSQSQEPTHEWVMTSKGPICRYIPG